MTKMYLIILIVLICVPFSNDCNALDKNKSLIVAEFKRDISRRCNYIHLVKYIFQNGNYISKEILFGSPTTREKTGSIVHFGRGPNFIHKNRYVISGVGNVIDLETKSLVIEENDKFVLATENELIFYREKYQGLTSYLKLDLKTRKYRFVENSFYDSVNGIQSPNSQYALKVKGVKNHFGIELFDRKKTYSEEIVDNAGQGTKLDTKATATSDVPVFWVDNENFIYAQYSSIVRIRLVNIHDKSNIVLGRLFFVPLAFSNAYFYRDPNEDVIFQCTKGYYKVDLENNTIEQQSYSQAGFQFQVEKVHDEIGHNIRYKGHDIGKLPIRRYVATEGYFAADYQGPGATFGFLKGIKVWNNITEEWTTINIDLLDTIIGWVDE